MNMRKPVLAIPAAVAAIGASFAPVASGATEVDHANDHGVVVIEDSYVPCVGSADTITLDINQMGHSTENKNGYHERWVFTGTFEADLTAGGVSAGRVTFSDVADNSRMEQYIVETDVWSGRVLSGVGVGTKWNWTQHYTGPMDEEGDWIIDQAKAFFSQARCRWPTS